MSPPGVPAPIVNADLTVGSLLARSHDRSMTLCDQMLGPVMDPDATFVERWSALRFVSEQLQERCDREQKLLDELRTLLPPEVQVRLERQGDEVVRLRQDVELLAAARGTGHNLANAMQSLIQALRIWYAEIEFSLGELHRSDISPRAAELLNH